MPRISMSTISACRKRLKELYAKQDSRLPVDVNALAHALGVRSIEPAYLKVDGYVGLADDGSLVIRYRHANTIERDRFTIAHEIGHLLIAEVTGIPITTEKMRTGFDSEESAANQLAAEILMPADSLLAQLCGRSPSWGFVQELRKLFKVSAYALLRRTTEIDSIAGIFATFDFDDGDIDQWGFCNATSKPQLTFTRPFREMVSRELRRGERDNFCATALVARNTVQIPCELRIASSSEKFNSWAFGWAPI